jgi:hypothetical protein
MEEEKIFNNIWELLEEHECETWEQFRSFVHYATDDVSDVGYISGNSETETFSEEDLEEINGIYFLTENEAGKILYFPITFEELYDEIENLKIFKN